MSDKYGKNDVLTLKGAAAQQTTHHGNLAYYQLCELRYEEFSKAESKKARRNICQEIVVKITNEYGGVFRKYNGVIMDMTSAVNKTMDRFRQIRKPKVVPPKSVGEDDVVFKVGAANHLFPGNAKWRLLLDQHARSYWPELFSDTNNVDDGENAESATKELIRKRVRRQRTYYQVAIAHKLIDIIEGRGGKFRNAALNVMEEREDVLVKIHERFKDIKKYIKNGTYQSPLSINKNHDSDPADLATAENFYVIKRTGCTSTKATILHGEHNTKINSTKRRKKKEGENTGDIAGDGEDDMDSMELIDRSRKLKRRKEQAEARRDRAQRREEAIEIRNSDQDRASKAKRNRKKKTNTIMPPELPDDHMSDYEKLRFEKMQKNYEYMVSLGLCAGATAEV